MRWIKSTLTCCKIIFHEISYTPNVIPLQKFWKKSKMAAFSKGSKDLQRNNYWKSLKLSSYWILLLKTVNIIVLHVPFGGIRKKTSLLQWIVVQSKLTIMQKAKFDIYLSSWRFWTCKKKKEVGCCLHLVQFSCDPPCSSVSS